MSVEPPILLCFPCIYKIKPTQSDRGNQQGLQITNCIVNIFHQYSITNQSHEYMINTGK